MFEMLVKLIVGASLLQLGINLTKDGKCDSRECLAHVERASREVVHIHWKPISVFPKEAARFK
ncbi:MAG: hypothetical protein EOP06_10115 [Proteobacteria bacterium]|nr:MAG: hypothetical protein EOP06_10115 [Pseudomonadota bacterium]